MTPNHRANDVIVLENKPQSLNARFSYGHRFNFLLSGEVVDIYKSKTLLSSTACHTSASDWDYLASEITDFNGKVKYELPDEQRLELGIHKIRMVVKQDDTYVDFFVAVLPLNTEAIVFCIEALLSENKLEPFKNKNAAVIAEIVRYWQQLGYLIVYVTKKPDVIHHKIHTWLLHHKFPLGMVLFNGIIPWMKNQARYLPDLGTSNGIKLHTVYSTKKGIDMYAQMGLDSSKIFCTDRIKKNLANKAVV